MKPFPPPTSRQAALLTLVIALPLILLQGYLFVANEEKVYIWDSKAYWITWQQFSALSLTHTYRWLHETIGGIEANDYNPLAVSLLFPFYYLPLASRYAYILALTVCYLLPAVLLVQLTLQRFAVYQSRAWVVFIAIAAVSFAPFWKPTLRGLPDIVGLLPVLGAVIFVLSRDLAKKLSWRNILIIGLLLWMPFLLRRWYAYTVVTLYITLPLLNFVNYSWSRNNRLRRLLNLAITFLAAGIVSAVCALVCQHLLIERIIATNYSTVYSAYQDGFKTSVILLMASPGYVILAPMAVGLIWALAGARTFEKNFTLFCLANLVISFYLFTRTQSPGIQHCLPFALWMFFVAMPGVRLTVTAWRQPWWQCSVLALGALASLVIALVTFNNLNLPAAFNSALLPDKNYPMGVANFRNYQALAARLLALTQNGDQVAVLSSNGALSDDLIATLTDDKIDSQIAYASQVDLRDKIRVSTLLARYVVVADPIQLHLNPDGQRVIWIPASEILAGTGIGAAYQELPGTYQLSNKVTAKIYEKIRPFTAPEIIGFLSRFTAAYPDWQPLYFNGFTIPYLTATITKGDIWGRFLLSDDSGSLYTHPGEHIPTSANWYFGNLQTVTVTSNNICPGADGVLVTFKTLSGLTDSVNIPDGGSRQINLAAFDHQMGSLTIDKKANSICDSTTLAAD
jgi:hypothetical protein